MQQLHKTKCQPYARTFLKSLLIPERGEGEESIPGVRSYRMLRSSSMTSSAQTFRISLIEHVHRLLKSLAQSRFYRIRSSTDRFIHQISLIFVKAPKHMV